MYASEEEKVKIDEDGQLTIIPKDGEMDDDDQLMEEEAKVDWYAIDRLNLKFKLIYN